MSKTSIKNRKKAGLCPKSKTFILLSNEIVLMYNLSKAIETTIYEIHETFKKQNELKEILYRINKVSDRYIKRGAKVVKPLNQTKKPLQL